MGFRAFCVWLCLATALLAQSEEIHFEGVLEPDDAIWYDASVWPPAEVEDEPAPEWVRSNVSRWFDRLVELGVTVIGVKGFNGSGELYMHSAALQKVGFRATPFGDLLELFCGEAKRCGVILEVCIEDLAYLIETEAAPETQLRCDELSVDVVAAVVGELGTYAAKHDLELWVSEEAFTEEYCRAIARSAAAHGLTYMHFFDDPEGLASLCVSEDYSTYPRDLAGGEEDRKLWRVVGQWGGNTLGLGTLVFASQAARGRPAGVGTSGGWGLSPGCQLNVALMRAAQFAPSFYAFFQGWTEAWPDVSEADARFCWSFNFTEQLQPLLDRYARKPSETKPVANLILCYPPETAEPARELFEVSLLASIDAIGNALMAAGYELRVTYDAPLTGPVEVYYVFCVAGCSEEGVAEDLPGSVAGLLDADSKVLVQAVGVPCARPGWKKAMERLGLPPVPGELTFDWDRSTVTPIPEKVRADFRAVGVQEVRYRGYYLWPPDDPQDLGRVGWYQLLSDLREGRASDTQVLVASAAGLPLVTERQGKYFINGNFLHLEFSEVLANLLAERPVFERPTYAYVTTGAQRSVLFAAADTEVELRLPPGVAVAQWDESGRVVEPPTVTLEEGVLRGTLKRWHLVIVTGQ